MNLDDTEALINEIGAQIVSNDAYTAVEWDAIALVVTILPGQKGMTGYIYSGDSFRAMIPRPGRAVLEKCVELHTAMTPEEAEPWKQALIHITRPGPQINIKFEYDDQTRWSLKKVSLDTSDYANSLRPPRPEPVRAEGLPEQPSLMARWRKSLLGR